MMEITFRHTEKSVQLIETAISKNKSSRQWVSKMPHTLARGDRKSRQHDWSGIPWGGSAAVPVTAETEGRGGPTHTCGL